MRWIDSAGKGDLLFIRTTQIIETNNLAPQVNIKRERTRYSVVNVSIIVIPAIVPVWNMTLLLLSDNRFEHDE